MNRIAPRLTGPVATQTALDVAHLVFEPVVTVGAAALTHAVARSVSRRPAAWAVGAAVASFGVHRGCELLIPGPNLLDASIQGSVFVAVVTDYVGSILVFTGTPIVVWLLTRNRPTLLDADR